MNAKTIRETTTSRFLYPKSSPSKRMFALWYFGSLILVWTIVGHTFLGFEQSWASPFVAVATAVAVTWLLEIIRANGAGEKPRFAGGVTAFGSTFIPALIPGLAVAMLLYPNENLMPLAFASALSIASKVLIRVRLGNATQHVFNPSNFGITLTLLLFPAVGLAPPYHFTENLTGVAHWILPLGILASGLVVHGYATGRLPLCAAWIVGFVAQGAVRSLLFGIPWNVPLMPMTSAAFILFTLYMIPDPATTPLDAKRQVGYGLGLAAVYGILISAHIVFGLFIALFAMSAMRGLGLAWNGRNRTVSAPVMAGAASAAGDARA